MKIRIIWVGRTKEPYLNEGIERYLKLLSPMAQVAIVEIKEHKGKNAADSLSEEGEKILRQTQSYTLLDQTGREFTSPGFARLLQERGGGDFLIGGPYGVSDEIKDKAKETIALSRMTFTHEMVRVFFFEQLFRAMTIIHNKEYHH
ncbi:MAG: 23S rRNA (pseudouridine(1915)-N(3))-methyltransferase RlmH [Dissulfurispiraceae bacterium]